MRHGRPGGLHIADTVSGRVSAVMGSSHALTGLLVGVGAAAVLPAPMPVRLLVIPVCGGSALLPDCDHRSARVARSLGPITRWAAAGINAVCLDIYEATRTDLDRDRRDGHRTASHTVPGALMFGLLVAVVAYGGPWVVVAAGGPPGAAGLPLAVTLGFLVGLTGVVWGGRGFVPAGVAVVVAWWVTTSYPGWSAVWPVVVFAGSLAGVLGDACTPSGVPLWWPLVVGGQRWRMVTTPATFRTGSPSETHIVTPLLGVAVVVEVGLVTGVLPALAGALGVVLGG